MQRKTKNGFGQYSRKENSSKQTKKKKIATYEEITYRLAFGLAPELMIKPLNHIIKQNRLKIVINSFGIMGEKRDFSKMINILYNSVRYN